MFNFALTPPSGYPDSYYDVQFLLEFDKKDSTRIRLVNETTNETLKIIGVNTGTIEDETDILVSRVGKVQGFFNLFNADKMNLRLQNREYVTIKAVVESDEQTREVRTNFYNESNSLDAGILPFDVTCKNSVIDTKNLTPLTLTVTCSSEKKIEFCIRRKNELSPTWHFEVLAHKGQTVVCIPAEVLFEELKAEQFGEAAFKLYYVQFEGFDYKGFLNRKYLPIHGILIKFASKILSLRRRTRNGPDETPLPDDFVLGNYFALTHKDFAAVKTDPTDRLLNVSRYFYETLDMRSQTQMQVMSTHSEMGQSLQTAALQKSIISVPSLDKPYLSPFSNTSRNSTALVAPQPKKGGCGCSRKKVNA